jgi:hypothetical protein
MKRSIIFLLCNTALFAAAPGITLAHIHVDQFGYPPDAAKVAVIANPMNGYNNSESYIPGSTLQVHRTSDDVQVYSGPVTSWNGGSTHGQSGDQAWWFDFSALTTPGEYYIYDPDQDASSFTFEIAQDVYLPVLKQAVRSFFYQRCGHAKSVPYAHSDWADVACHLGPQQDLDCRLVSNTDPSTSQDLSGGWHDAGDFNKYVNYADGTLHYLLLAYEENPAIWGDDYDLPESGNGVPDILDEMKWELDWLLKMQQSDGSSLFKVSVTGYERDAPPSHDTAFRRYAPATASATISACGAFAHAAIVYQASSDAAMQAFGATLETAAIAAWDWLEANPDQIPSDYNSAGFSLTASEDSHDQQFANRVSAAAYLFVLTGDTEYRTFFDTHYQNVHLMQWTYAYPFEDEYQNALLYYSNAPGATASVVTAIENAYSSSLQTHLGNVTNGTDAYRAYLSDGNYTWGSNKTKMGKGSMFANMNVYGLNAANSAAYRNAAAGYIHYIHGVNPNAIVYLSNMNGFAAEYSVDEFYHGWFWDGTDWDNVQTSLYGPAPGFMPGGPNPGYAPSSGYISPPQDQPIQKSWKVWNTGWPEDSWEVTENHIPMQASYIQLLSKFVELPPAPSPSIISLKVMLQGPFQAGAMSAYLADHDLIPLSQPYHSDPWNYNGSEAVPSIPAGITDWILVELWRTTDRSSCVSQKAAFLQTDGDIMDLDGTTPIDFTVPEDEYYIAVHHRNHGSVTSASPVSLAGSPAFYDFSTAQTQSYGSVGMTELSGGFWGLWAGDMDQDHEITTADYVAWYNSNHHAETGYLDCDLNFDGAVDLADYELWLQNARVGANSF